MAGYPPSLGVAIKIEDANTSIPEGPFSSGYGIFTFCFFILAQLSGSSELRYKMSSVSRQQEQYLDLRNIAAGNRTCSIFKQQAAGNSRCDWLTREAGE